MRSPVFTYASIQLYLEGFIDHDKLKLNRRYYVTWQWNQFLCYFLVWFRIQLPTPTTMIRQL